jgi:hypothetical protein
MRRLADHPGIGLVAARGDREPVLLTAAGTYVYRPGIGAALFEGLSDADAVESGLLRLLEFPHSGDLILFGRWGLWGTPELVVSFERQRGTHGAVGGEQCYPFIMAPSGLAAALANVQAPEELYQYFMGYSQPESERADADTVVAGVAASSP